MKPLFILWYLFIVPSAYAQSGAVSASTGLLQIGLALAAVIGLMLLAAWLMKRLGPIATNNRVAMKIVGGMSLGNRERIIVVEIADQWMVLGVTAQQITSLANLPKQELAGVNSTALDDEKSFSYWLKKTLAKRKEDQQQAGS